MTVAADGSYAVTIALQAARHDNDKDGRRYTITVSAHDNAGNTGSGVTGVTVPNLPGGDLTWQLLAPLSSPRYALAAAAAPDGSIFAIGGADWRRTRCRRGVPTGVQSVACCALAPAPKVPAGRCDRGRWAHLCHRGHDPGGEGLLNSVLALTPGADQWVAVAPMSVERQSPAATAGADGRIYVVGGHNNNLGGALNLLEILRPCP